MSFEQRLIVVIVGLGIFCLSIYLIGNFIAKRYISKRPYSQLNLIVTKFGYIFYSISLFLLFSGFSMKWFAPETIIGRLVSSYKGMIIYTIGLCIVLGVIERCLSMKGYRTTREEPNKTF
jgi:hypothetical protein